MSLSARLRRATLGLGLLTASGLLSPALAKQAAGKPAADFALPELRGGTVKLAELRGKIVLGEFWATWCEPCTKELPELEKLQQQFAARDVVIVGISLDKERKNALDLAGSLKLKFKLLHDPEGKVAEAYDPPKMPSSYVIDRDGVVRFVNEGFSGAADVAKLRRELEQLSAVKATSEARPPG